MIQGSSNYIIYFKYFGHGEKNKDKDNKDNPYDKILTDAHKRHISVYYTIILIILFWI